VSGEQPAFLVHELYKVLEYTLRFWKGMTRTYFIHCPKKVQGGGYCTGEFKLDAVLRRVKEQNNAEFSCVECDTAWKPEQLILGFESFSVDQNYILGHLYHRDKLLCPSLFLIEPAEKRLRHITSWADFVGKRFKITLLSELSGQKIASREFSFTRQWVGWVAPIARVASLALAGAALPITGDLATEIQEGIGLLDKVASLPGGTNTEAGVSLDAPPQSVGVTDQQRAKFAKFLSAIDLDPREQGMDIAQAADGRWLWMSAQEVQSYTPQEAARF
jgi:hypothetical protein